MHNTSESDAQGRAFLVGVELVGQPSILDVEASLEELALLADTAGLEVLGQAYQKLRQPDPATFIGRGKVEEVRNWVEELLVDVVVFDEELSPRHQRELERVFGEDVRVLDRTALILDIFAQHAHTKEGSLQVALAQYEYRLPRLTRQWTHLARQAGGGTARGGAAGVGLRGPGETQLETDRREIRRKISKLHAELDGVKAHRERHRAQRRRSGIPVVALVGYTNAGKSTLLNHLTGAGVYVADQLFATLDPTTRRVTLSNGSEVLFTDTVGFIQKLPHTLVAAFRSTLEEAAEASLLVHVVDASHPSALEQIEIVNQTLVNDLGIEDIPIILALNKMDRRETESANPELRAQVPDAIPISARTGDGLDTLLARVQQVLAAQRATVLVRIPYADGTMIARFHELADVQKEVAGDEAVELSGTLDRHLLPVFATYLVQTDSY